MRALPLALRSVSAPELVQRIEAERRGVPFLLYVDGDGDQHIATLEGTALSVGRLPSTDVPLAWDTEVSRVHAMLERVGDEWTVVDNGLSRNGTFVNGERVRGRRRLSDRDALRVGRTQIVVLTGGQHESRTTEATRDLPPPPVSAAQRRVLIALCRPLGEHGFGAPSSNREIADELVLSVETVKRHLRDLFERFGVRELPQNRKRAELALRALERGAIRVERDEMDDSF
jgi:pSer/pThr/pTyr-binding forkhead associated (FHA) protein